MWQRSPLRVCVQSIAFWSVLTLTACDSDAEGHASQGSDASTSNPDAGSSIVRGRLTDVTGQVLKDVEIEAAGVKARTDERGQFTLKLNMSGAHEVRLAVESDEFSTTALAVTVGSDPANLEVSVKTTRRLMLSDAGSGGRVEGDDGFALELPASALRDGEGNLVAGEVEVRYALIKQSRDVTAAPGRMQANGGDGLDGLGMAEVRFYKEGRRLVLDREVSVEIPLYDGHGIAEGTQVDSYALGASDARWQPGSKVAVTRDKVVMTTRHDRWIGVAKKLPIDSCVTGKLGIGNAADRKVANTTVRAARARGLSLIQAETGNDGSFCLPVTPDDDWSVSTFYDDGDQAFGIDINVNSAAATGMCGGAGCKQVGDVALPTLSS